MQTSSFIPPCNTQATDPSDVYNLTDSKSTCKLCKQYVFVSIMYLITNPLCLVITPIEMELLKSPAKTLIKATKQDVAKWRDNERYLSVYISVYPFIYLYILYISSFLH